MGENRSSGYVPAHRCAKQFTAFVIAGIGHTQNISPTSTTTTTTDDNGRQRTMDDVDTSTHRPPPNTYLWPAARPSVVRGLRVLMVVPRKRCVAASECVDVSWPVVPLCGRVVYATRDDVPITKSLSAIYFTMRMPMLWLCCVRLQAHQMEIVDIVCTTKLEL